MNMPVDAPAKAMIEPSDSVQRCSLPQQPHDIARWRKACRTELLEQRTELNVADREARAACLGAHLLNFIASRFDPLEGRVISGYWPIKSELDLRPTLDELHNRGARLALPVVEERGKPLSFRAWAPGAKMERGFWNIPVPQTKITVIPNIALAPLVGWDGSGYRLGYGGGYFDRTLAVLLPRPFVIGVGLNVSKLPSIFPQAHDIRLDATITDAGVEWSAR